MSWDNKGYFWAKHRCEHCNKITKHDVRKSEVDFDDCAQICLECYWFRYGVFNSYQPPTQAMIEFYKRGKCQ